VLLGWGSLALRKAGRRHQAAEASGGIIGAGFRIPQRLTDLEHRLVTAGQPEKGLDRYLRQLSRVMGSTDDRATELRHAAALLLRASVSRDLELSLTYCFMCLEALLLEQIRLNMFSAGLWKRWPTVSVHPQPIAPNCVATSKSCTLFGHVTFIPVRLLVPFGRDRGSNAWRS